MSRSKHQALMGVFEAVKARDGALASSNDADVAEYVEKRIIRSRQVASGEPPRSM